MKKTQVTASLSTGGPCTYACRVAEWSFVDSIVERLQRLPWTKAVKGPKQIYNTVQRAVSTDMGTACVSDLRMQCAFKPEGFVSLTDGEFKPPRA